MKKILIFAAMAALGVSVWAQDEEAQVYRRSSIYSVLVNHTEQKYAKEIRDAFLEIPVPDKFNDHNLSVKVVDMSKKLSGSSSSQENSELTDFLVNNKVASRLVARWFDRDEFTGACDMDLVKERGLYNANEFDKQLAMHSARGMAMLQDAGEDLIGQTYVLMNDIRYVDKNKGAKVASSLLRFAGALAGAYTGSSSISSATDNVGDLVDTYKGFSVKINTSLYKLEWTDDQAKLFYQEQYGDGKDMTKRDNFENGRGQWKLTYVGKVESKGGTTSFLGISEDEPEKMVRKACERALDDNIADLQRNYEGFRTRTPLVTIEPLTAYIGMKEGVSESSQFEVLQPVELENGGLKYERVGVIAPIKNLIWDNRYMAKEEGAAGSTLGYTTFKKVSGKDFSRGMLIREMNN